MKHPIEEEGRRPTRRAFLKQGLGASAAALAAPLAGCSRDDTPDAGPAGAGGWRSGEVAHLLPTADHRRILLKASFSRPQRHTPLLVVGDRRAAGVRTDMRGRFFTFDVDGLAPSTDHRLQLVRGDGTPLCDDWPLRTFPAPDTSPDRFRLLAFTCAGGPDDLYSFGSLFNAYLPIAARQRLLARALAYAPDAMIANGDHVYWDMKSRFGWAMGRSPVAWWRAGFFDRESPIAGHSNEEVLVRAFERQIAGLYGVLFRSTPSFFLQDDHDYGENDEASDALRTFPADPFMKDLARTTQRLFYPELIAGPGVPAAWQLGGGLAESFGTLRYGRLFEALLYDCRRALTNASDPATGDHASGFVPPDVEAWLAARSQGSDAAHLVHMPSTPVLWTAGKWGEWYPDFKDEHGDLRADVEKPYWPEGWNAQHDRLLSAVASRTDRTPVFASGDLHAIASGRILASGDLRLDANPVASVLVGPVGTGALGWPSKFRAQRPLPSGTLRAEEWVEPIEENGFSLLDVTPEALTVSMFRWHPDQGVAAIDSLEPFDVRMYPRPGA